MEWGWLQQANPYPLPVAISMTMELEEKAIQKEEEVQQSVRNHPHPP